MNIISCLPQICGQTVHKIRTRGGGGKKFENFADVIYWKPPYLVWDEETDGAQPHLCEEEEEEAEREELEEAHVLPEGADAAAEADDEDDAADDDHKEGLQEAIV